MKWLQRMCQALGRSSYQLSNRRASLRLSTCLPLGVGLRGEYPAWLVDLSEGGLRLRVFGLAQAEPELKIRCYDEMEGPGKRSLRARVCWQRRQPDGLEIGLTRLDSETCLDWLYQKLIKQLSGPSCRDARRHRRFALDYLEMGLSNLSTGFASPVACQDLGLGGAALKVPAGLAQVGHVIQLQLGPSPGWQGLVQAARVAAVESISAGRQALRVAFFQSGGRRFESLLESISTSHPDKALPALDGDWLSVCSSKAKVEARPFQVVEPELRDCLPIPRVSLKGEGYVPPVPPLLITPKRTPRCPSVWAARSQAVWLR